MNLRRSSLGLLLFLLAMLSRATAPYAMPQATFDPIAGAPICSHDGSTQQAPQDGGAPLADHQHCAFACCQVFVAAPDALAAPTIVSLGVRVDWTSGSSASFEQRSDSGHFARGPPAFS